MMFNRFRRAAAAFLAIVLAGSLCSAAALAAGLDAGATQENGAYSLRPTVAAAQNEVYHLAQTGAVAAPVNPALTLGLAALALSLAAAGLSLRKKETED